MNAQSEKWSSKRHQKLGFFTLGLLILGLGSWAVFTEIAGAIIASGTVEVEINRQVVQHPDGGVISEILVDDGDVVEVGDVLIRFDDTFLRTDVSAVQSQLFEISARKSRLRAERDGSDAIPFDKLLIDNSNVALVIELMEGQTNLFNARIDTLAREESLLREKIAQINEQIVGSEAQHQAFELQQSLISEELVDENALLEKGLSQASTVRALQREEARLGGQTASVAASIAESRGKIAEIEIEILRLRTRLREDAITTLRDLQFREIELSEKLRALQETLQRMDVRAPSSGVIFGNLFHAVRSVVRPAEPILYIVPQDTVLVIATRIPTVHIDQVHVGQLARLQFSAFDLRTTPEISGTVVALSPDIFTDEITGEAYYSAEILPTPEELAKLGDLQILPGMPVEAFLKTGERTPLEYLLKPLAVYFNRAFRES